MKTVKPYENSYVMHVEKKSKEVLSFMKIAENGIPKQYNAIKNRVVSDSSFTSRRQLCVAQAMYCRQVNLVNNQRLEAEKIFIYIGGGAFSDRGYEASTLARIRCTTAKCYHLNSLLYGTSCYLKKGMVYSHSSK